MNENPRLIVEINSQTLEVSFSMNAAPLLRGTMIGACEMAKNWIINSIVEDNAKNLKQKNLLAKKTPFDKNLDEQEISRDAALDYYSAQMWEIQERMKAVRSADERATFKISPPR